MKTYNVTCPICGTVNHDLYLDETSGFMECEHCGQVSNLREMEELKKIQVFTEKQISILFAKDLSATV